MFSLSGEKSNLSSGIASAASTTSFSTRLISRSIDDAMVGGVDGDGDASAAGELLADCAKAEAAATDKNAPVINREGIFIELLVFRSEHERLVRVISKKRDDHGRMKEEGKMELMGSAT